MKVLKHSLLLPKCLVGKPTESVRLAKLVQEEKKKSSETLFLSTLVGNFIFDTKPKSGSYICASSLWLELFHLVILQ